MMRDLRNIPPFHVRPCKHCEYRHYFLIEENDAETCPMCQGELYPVVTVYDDPLMALQEFVQHKSRCDALQPMWDKGPCSCGLTALLNFLRAVAPPKALQALGSGAVSCTTCGDKRVLDNDVECPNCR